MLRRKTKDMIKKFTQRRSNLVLQLLHPRHGENFENIFSLPLGRFRRSTSDDEDLKAKWNAELIAALRSTVKDDKTIKGMVAKCLDEGADINFQNTRGKTTLHLAIEKGYVEVVRFLLSKNARTDIPDNQGQTASVLGKSSTKKEIADLFQDGTPGDGSKKRKPDDGADSESRKKGKFLNEMEIPSGGSKSAQHGNIFQLKLLMLFLIRAREKGYTSFRLATELDEAGKFDDVVFQYLKGDVWRLRLFQAKHKEGFTSESDLPKISLSDLLSTNEAEEFSIPKYFNSYLEIMQRVQENSVYSVFSNSELDDILLITNTGFGSDELKQYFEIDPAHNIETDPLLKVNKQKNPNWQGAAVYKLKDPQHNSLITKLKPLFDSNSDFTRLVEDILECVHSDKLLEKTGLVKNYYYGLLKEVFGIKKTGQMDHHLEFLSKFLTDNNLPEETAKFRNALLKEIMFMRNKNKIKMSDSFGRSELPRDNVELEALAKKLAYFVEKNKPLTISDYSNSHTAIMDEVINPDTKKFRGNFIAPGKDDTKKKLRDMIKTEIATIRGVSKITNDQMQLIEFKISPNFGKSKLPDDHRTLENLAKTLGKMINDNIQLNPSLTPELQIYHVALAKEVIDINTKTFRESFLSGKIVKGTSVKSLPASSKEFRNSLLNSMVSIDNKLDEFKDIKIKISKGFADEFKLVNDADVKIDNIEEFSRQIEQLISKTAGSNIVVINDNSVTKDKWPKFATNIQSLGGHVLTNKFKKIRFSSSFLNSNDLPSNLLAFKNKLKANLGDSKFNSLYSYEFDIKGLNFRTCEDGALSRKLPILHNERHILNFFNKFKLVVNYPNRKEITTLVEGEFRHAFNELDSKISHSLYLETMHDWMADRIGTFYTPEKAKTLFENIQQELKSREMEGITKYYFSLLSSDYKFNKNYDYIIKFLESPQQQILHIRSKNVKLNSVKMVQTLNDLKLDSNMVKLNKYVWNQGNIFVSLDQMLIKDNYISQDVLNCFQDTTKANLLIIRSNKDKHNVHELYIKIADIIKNHPEKKIVLIAGEDDDFANKFSQDSTIKEAYILHEDIVRLHDLTEESQKRILDMDINFQGKNTKLSEITGGEEVLKQILDSNVLYEIISNKHISIGRDLRILGDINEYYTSRTFVGVVEIDNTIIYKRLDDFFVITDYDGQVMKSSDNTFIFNENNFNLAEAKFKELQQFSQSSVHWLIRESEKLFWVQSHGSISHLLQYRVLTESLTGSKSTSLSENQLIEDSNRYRTIVISDKPGMGKTTVLTNLGIKLQEKYPGLWVIRMDLNDYVVPLSKVKSINNQEEAKQFLLDALSNASDSQLKTSLEKILFERSFGKGGKLALLFDGFDEISPNYKDVVVQLLQNLKKTELKRLLVTTRLNMRQTLEENLEVISHIMEPFTKENQKEFMTKFWRNRAMISDNNLRNYVNYITDNFLINNRGIEDFTGVPLQLKMIAEYFLNDVQEGKNLPESLNQKDLYERFVKSKYDIFQKEKQKKALENPALERDEKLLYTTYLEEHEKMALYTLFEEENLKVLISKEYVNEVNSIMAQIETYHERRGLISEIINNRPHFVHRTFAEFFAAEYFSRELNKHSISTQNFILTRILVGREYRGIRTFMNYMLTEQFSDSVGNEINQLWQTDRSKNDLFNRYGESILHVSAEEGHTNIFKFLMNSININTQLHMLDTEDPNGLTVAQTAAIYEQREILEMLQKRYHYGKAKTVELRSQIFEQLKGNFGEAMEAQKKLRRIAEICLPKFPFFRRRRTPKNNRCFISWDDIDRIVTEPTRYIEDVQIDSEKFMEFSKILGNDAKNTQLLDLVQQIKNVDNDRIVGKQKYLLDQVLSDEGFRNFIQKERLNELADNTIRTADSKISPVLKKRLLNAAGKLQLTMGLYGVYGTVMTCKDGTVDNCIKSVSEIGYNLLSQPLESAVIKITPKVVSQAGHVGARIVPRVLGYDTKFLIQFSGLKYGTKVVKGAAGVLGGVFDIVDAAISTKALIECDERKHTDNPCSDKEIRDNIASISFAGIAFVSGIALAGASFGLSVAVSFVIMAASVVYSGISNIIEYEEKYDTTSWENFRIFWHTVAIQPMPEDVLHLAARTDYVNTLATRAAEQLRSMSDVAGYSFGLGRVAIIDSKPHFQSHSSFIDLGKPTKKRYSLSRVLPKHIDGIETICLPRKTGSNYEYNDESYNSYKSEYYCENAVTIVLKERLTSDDRSPTIFYDLTNINSGFVQGNASTQNIFYLNEGNPLVRGGEYTSNNFILTNCSFSGFIEAGWNSTNVIDTTELKSVSTRLSWKNEQPKYTYLDLTITKIDENSKRSISVEKSYRESRLSFKGSKNNVDNINCEMEDGYINHSLLIDAGGGAAEGQMDHLVGCTDAVVWPNTKIEAQKGNYTYYVRTQGYTSVRATSEIDVIGEGKIIFLEHFLLKDCKSITYSLTNNILSFDLPLSPSGSFILHVKNYLNKNKIPNFLLVDKFGNYVIPKLLDKEILEMFEMHAVYSDTNELSAAVEYYDKLLTSITSEKQYKVFGLVKFLSKTKNSEDIKTATFGSQNGDVFILDSQTIYARGNLGSDIYLVNANTSWESFDIDNTATDLKLDALCVPFKSELRVTKMNANLRLNIKDMTGAARDKFINVLKYFDGDIHQHVMIVDHDNNNFLPFKSGASVSLVSFYHASDKRNVFVLLPTTTQAIIDCEIDNMAFYKRDESLVISSKKLIDISGPLTVILKFFYSNQTEWQDMELYSYNKGKYGKIDLNNIELTGTSNDDVYGQVLKEYTVDFYKKSVEIAHNQFDGINDINAMEQEKIGLLIFKDTKPLHLEVFTKNNDVVFRDKEDLNEVVLKNWHRDNKYVISIIEFDYNIDPIRIYVRDKTVDLKTKLEEAQTLENVRMLITDDLHKILKCTLAINCLQVTDSYRALGFTHFQQAAAFIRNCDFSQFKLTYLRGIKIFLPTFYLQIYSVKINLEGYDSANVNRYTDIVWDHFSPILTNTKARIEIDMVLENEIEPLDSKALQIVEYFLLLNCPSYSGKGVLSESLKIEPPLGNIVEPKVFVKSVLLLMAKSYNELLFKYPQVEKDVSLNIHHNSLHVLDITIIDGVKNNQLGEGIFDNFKTILDNKIQKVIEALSAKRVNDLTGNWDQYVKQNIFTLTTISEQDVPFSSIKVEYKKYNSSEEKKNNRKQRFIRADNQEDTIYEERILNITSGGSAKPSLINDFVNWLSNGLSVLKSLDCFNWLANDNTGNILQATIDNPIVGTADPYDMYKNTKSNSSRWYTKSEAISNSSMNGMPVFGTLDFSYYDTNSTLLLMDVVTRTFTGEKYLSSKYITIQDTQHVVKQKEHAQCLAYNYYCYDNL